MPLPLWISSLFAGGIEEALGTAALRVGSRAWNTKQIATTMNKVIGGWGGGSASDMVRAGLSKTGNLPRAEMLTGDAANLTSSKLVTSWIGTAQRRADPKIILGKKGGWSKKIWRNGLRDGKNYKVLLKVKNPVRVVWVQRVLLLVVWATLWQPYLVVLLKLQ